MLNPYGNVGKPVKFQNNADNSRGDVKLTNFDITKWDDDKKWHCLDKNNVMSVWLETVNENFLNRQKSKSYSNDVVTHHCDANSLKVSKILHLSTLRAHTKFQVYAK